MKIRRFFCLLLAMILVFTLIPGAGAADDLFFVAVNDTIPLTLTAQPYTSGSTVYVPYSVFDVKPGGVVPGYDAQAQTLILFTRDRHLIFDAAAGTVVDDKGNSSGSTAIYLGGVMYVPLVFCASYFGLTASMLESADGYPVLRFTTGGEAYDNALFIEKAENLIAYRATQSTPTDEPEPPQAPQTAPVPEEEPTEGDEEDTKEPAIIYLAYTNAANAENTMQALEDHRLRGTFFFTADEILQNRALIRRIYAAGHLLGVTCPSDSTDVQADLLRADDALDAVLQTRTVMALLPADRAGEAEDFRVFSPEIGLPAADAAADPSAVHLLVCSSGAGQTLATLAEAEADISLLRETTILN